MTGKSATVGSSRPQNAGDDLVRILSKLTSDVERFDSEVMRQRQMLEHIAGHLGDLNNDELHRHSERISLEAAEMVACARQALEELNRLAEPTHSQGLAASLRSRSRGLPRDRRAG